MAPRSHKNWEKSKRKGSQAAKPAEPRSHFKKPRKDKPAAAEAADLPSSILFPEGDADFPRGGGSLLTREEVAEARAEAEAEFERDERETGSSKGKRGRKGIKKPFGNMEDDDLGSLFGDGISGKLPRFANRINLKNILPNMKLLGVVVEINSKDLVISLPGGLRGFVRSEEAYDNIVDYTSYKDFESNILCRVVHIGQLIPCVVLRIDDEKKDIKGNRRIWLSLRLSLLNKGLSLDAIQDGMVIAAQVKSVEDHGYIVHFGVPTLNGFMPRGNDDNDKIQSGQLILCVAKNVDRTRAIVHLSSDSNAVSKCVTKDIKGLSISHLIPGMMVNARVLSTLENGLILSFLTYFTGTVDVFHLPNIFATGTWKDEYKKNMKVNARILFIDPSTRAVGLTLNPYLVKNEVPPIYVKPGEIYDSARVLRIDKGIGLLLEIPSSPAPSPAYVGKFDVSDEDVKLDRKFKEGTTVRVRVLGMRHLEGLAVGILKASAFEGSLFTHSDVKPGMIVTAKVIVLGDFGAIVQFSSGVKALCPLPHMSELDTVKPPKKFKVGAELLFRVLGCKSKRITVTLKKTLVKSKLAVLASYADASEGLVTHGWIAKIEKQGCFVRFYNGVHGFAHRSELGLEPGNEADSVYHVGQVIKCKIIRSMPALRKINISFVMFPKRAEDDTIKPGILISGVVERVTPAAAVVNVKGYYKGTILNEHLADYQGQASLMRSMLKPGYEFGQLLVLDIEGKNLVLSAKFSLINFASEIPSEVSQIHSGAVLHGYICNIIDSGCFVRYLGHLTGFCPKNKATDERLENILDAFYVGQSVRSHVLSVDTETDRIKLSLQHSLCSSSDVSLILGYFLLDEKISALQNFSAKDSCQDWQKRFGIGSLVEGVIETTKEFGVVLSFKDHNDVVGFVAEHQLGGTSVEVGSAVKAVVLDISRSDSLVDLSLKPELVNSASSEGVKKKRRRATAMDLKLHQEVNAVVEMVKETYVVLSLPEYNYAVGYASVIDYNSQKLPHKQFVTGQRVTATVGALSSLQTSERLLLQLKSLIEVLDNSISKRAKKSGYRVGSLVEAEIIDIKPLELFLKFGAGFRGRVHITEVLDDIHSMDSPFSKFKIGQLLHARIVAKAGQLGNISKKYPWELSLRPSLLDGDLDEINPPAVDFNFPIGSSVTGFIVKVDSEWVWLTVSRHIMANLFILDTSFEPSELQEFQQRHRVGQAIKGCVISSNKEKRLLRLKPFLSCKREFMVNQECSQKGSQETMVSNLSGAEHISRGDIVGGRIKKILPGVGGILVQIGPRLYGKAHYTEIMDTWVPQPLSGFHEGQYVKCKILDISSSSEGTVHVDLSLRPSLLGVESGFSAALNDNLEMCSKRFEKIEDLCPNMDVLGYVKSLSPKGCFIILSRTIDARILLSHLSDKYVESPEKEFPVGKLVHGRVLSVEVASKKAEVTLKKNIDSAMGKPNANDFTHLQVGDVIHGRIRRIESYGLFITLDNSKLVGLCHKSELSDEPLDDVDSSYKAGDSVKAKILKIDEERQRISLGMKQSYFDDVDAAHTQPNDMATDAAADQVINIHDKILASHNLFTPGKSGDENGEPAVTAEVESRASVLPLQVLLDESEDSDYVNDKSEDNTNGSDVAAKKGDRRTKKKAKEQRELEISASEARSLQKDIPRTEDEFEKLVRSSPNSSFVWINYMAFMLDLADVDKARAIAERALRTINIREEEEKLNIWVAYFNLENEYGSPPEEAVKKTFQRALPYCDPKKLHLALLGMYERTEQHKLADELLDRMTKKFKTSCKVWLRRIQALLNQGKDGAQSVVNRALLSLPRKKHIKFLSQVAILEFKHGMPDRGRSMFEGILREYPKRTDLWSVYIDQEIRLSDDEVIRALFERATCLSLPPKKMKFLFKKYLQYEKAHGDEDRVEHVKKKALEYVESSLA